MAREFYVVLFGRFAQVLTLILLLRVITGQLNPEEIGKTTILTSLIAFFALLFVNPIGMFIKRQLNTWLEKGVVLKKFGYAFAYLIAVSLLSTFFVFLLYQVFEPNWNIALSWLLGLVFGSLVINTVNQTLIPSFNMLGHRVYWVVYTIITLWSGLLLSWLLTKYSASAEFWMLGQLLGLLFGIVLSIIPFVKVVSRPKTNQYVEDPFQFKQLLSFACPIAIAVMLNWGQFQSYKFILSEFSGLEMLGLFSVGYAVSAGIITNFEATVQQYFHPIFYKAIQGRSNQLIADIWLEYANLLIPFIITTGLFVAIFCESITHLLIDEQYWGAAKYVALGAFIESIRAISNVYSLAAHALMKTKILLASQLSGAIVMIMSVILILRYSEDTYFWIGLVFASIIYLIHLVSTIKVSIKRVYQLKHILLVLSISALFLLIESVAKTHDRNLTDHFVLLAVSGLMYTLFNYYLFRRNLSVDMNYMRSM